MIFRLSRKLNAKIKTGPLRELPLHENPLADWSAALFVAGHTQHILLSNTKSLYSRDGWGSARSRDRSRRPSESETMRTGANRRGNL
jgi:hypothetical protein